MNTSNSTGNYKNTEAAVKTGVNLIVFVLASVFSYYIIQAVQRDLEMRQQIRYILLCHHLVCITAFFGLGFLFHGFRTFRVSAPRIVCWILFDLQITFGRGVLLTLALMAINTSLSICQPLRYLSIVHSVKRKVMIITWILAMLNPVWSTIKLCLDVEPKYITERDPTCPTALSGTASRVTAMVFLFLIYILIIISYFFIYREGKRFGHFSRTNVKGRKTILIHGLQISFHIIPTFITIATVNAPIVVNLINFILFSTVQVLSPIVFGLRCQELKDKLPAFKPSCRWMCCLKKNREVRDLGNNA
ncbi:probable G-protein coupled receptor 148 [Amia ocellicauda]|uniref:probable G-protein coupled receptor 148 n=1 Tax=Amia ocellicauda TaxID=2972642 RepID=UPI003464CAEF